MYRSDALFLPGQGDLAAVHAATFEFCPPFGHAAFENSTEVFGELNVAPAGVEPGFVVVFAPDGVMMSRSSRKYAGASSRRTARVLRWQRLMMPLD